MGLAQTEVAAAVSTLFPRATTFRFNKVKNEELGTESKREDVKVNIPVPSLQGIINIITLGANADESDEGKKAKKALEYLVEIVGDAVVKEVRQYVSDTPNASQDNIPWAKFLFDAIANMPAGIRGASSIAKELWEKFAKDYVAVFSVHGVPAEVAAARVAVFVQKFRPLTGNPERKSIIENLMATLAVYVDKTAQLEEFSPILEFLNKKADELKAEDTVVTASALGF